MRRSEARAKVAALAAALEDPERYSIDFAAILELDLADPGDLRLALDEAVMMIRRLATMAAGDAGRPEVIAEVGGPSAVDDILDAEE